MAGTGNVVSKVESYTTTAAQGPLMILSRSNNGTLGTQTAVDADDLLGGIYFQGSDGTGFTSGPNILAYADETWSGTASGGTLRFYTMDNTTTTADERMRIDHNGNVGIGTDSPAEILSLAPTLENMLSKIDKFADSAGTKHPICAIKDIIAVCLIIADLPDILGPVIIIIC